MNKSLIGRCGLYCGICEVYRAYKDIGAQYIMSLREELAKQHKCQPEEVRCKGCQAIGVDGWAHEKE